MMRTAELTGALLDYWVARADPQRAGIRWEQQDADWIGFGRIGSSPEFACWIVTDAFGLHERAALRDKHLSARFYEPSKDWAQGGPILEKVLMLDAGSSAYYGLSNDGAGGFDVSKYHHGDHIRTLADGPTPLVTAMRAYVASKYGDEVPAQEPGEQKGGA
jgi:hypothetical protein